MLTHSVFELMCLFITKKEALGTPTHAESTEMNVCIDEQHVCILARMATHAVDFLVSEIITDTAIDHSHKWRHILLSPLYLC